MSRLLQIRNMLVLLNQADVHTLSLKLNIPQHITQATLEILEIIGQVEKVNDNNHYIKACDGCSRRCNYPFYRLRSPKI